MRNRLKAARQAVKRNLWYITFCVMIGIVAGTVLVVIVGRAQNISREYAPREATVTTAVAEPQIEIVVLEVETEIEVEVEVFRNVYIDVIQPEYRYIAPEMFTLLGDDFRIVAYCPCTICTGRWNANRPVVGGRTVIATASRDFAVAGVTVAVDPSVIPLGSKIFIEGIGIRVAQDTGVTGNVIDVFFNTHAEANFMWTDRKVWLIDEAVVMRPE